MKDSLRKKTLGTTTPVREKTVEIDGEKYLLRVPTIAQRSFIDLASTVIVAAPGLPGGSAEKRDIGAFNTQILIACVHDPETKESIFEQTDADVLLAQPSDDKDSWYAKLVDAVLTFITEKGSPAKNSEATAVVS